MTTKLTAFQKLYNNLINYLKQAVKSTQQPSFPSLAETILFLNTQIELGNDNIEKLENNFKHQISIYSQANEETKEKARRYLCAMIDLLKE